MDINEKIIKLLVASGNVSEEKVEQARKLAESLTWEEEAAQQSAQADGEPKTIEEAITKARDAHDWAQVSLLETVRDMRDLQ